jgi:hypothetical protein
LTTELVGVTTTKDIWKFQILGSLDSDSAIFGNNKIIVSGDSAYYGTGSDPNSPQAGTIGDIQATSSLSLTQPSQNMFIFDHAIGTVNGDNYIAGVSYIQSGVKSLKVYPKFPTRIGGQTWQYNFQNKNMWYNSTNPGAILATFSSVKPFNFTRTIDVVCPEIIELNATGCFNCDLGGQITVKALSKCKTGLVTVYLDSPNARATTTSIPLTTEPEIFVINFLTGVSDNEYDLVLIGTKMNSSRHISFTAIENLTLRSDNTTNSSGVGDGTGGINLSFSLLNPTSAAEWGTWAAIILGILIVLVITIPLAYKVISTCCLKSKTQVMAMAFIPNRKNI